MASRLVDLLPLESITLDATAGDWRAAVRASGDALVAGGSTTSAYTDEMVGTVERLGPYIVIAPGLALAHARPSAAVLRNGLSWVRLAEPVAFGHPQNDPVTLVVGLAAIDHDAHSQSLAELSGLLSDAGVMGRLQDAVNASCVRQVIVAATEEGAP